MREAGELARSTSRGEFKRWTKGHDHSPVSEADIAVNNFLRARLGALAPEAGWLSEETEDDPRTARPPTALDRRSDRRHPRLSSPACRTGPFRWRWSRRPARLAALFAPVTDEMFLARRRRRRHPQRRGDRRRAPAPASPAPNWPAETLSRPAGEACTRRSLPQPKVHSLALRLTRVAHGDLDVAFASPGSHDWDLAAADLLVHEAGGAMTDLTGRPLRYNQPHTAHDALIAAGPPAMLRSST